MESKMTQFSSSSSEASSQSEGKFVYPGPQETRASYLPKLVVKPWIPAPPPDRVLRNCQVIDPASGSLLPGLQDVVIMGGLIRSVTASESGVLAEGLQEIDVCGQFVCPGLTDCHVHCTAVPGVRTMSELMRLPEQVVSMRTAFVLKEMLLRGFTTVRDTGGATKPLAVAIEEYLVPGPRLFQCGKALSQTGGHADYVESVSGGSPTGCCGGHSECLGRTVDGVPEVLRAVREELKCGADFIKVMVGGGVSSATDPIEMVQYSSEEIQAITMTCKQFGNRLVTAHAYTNQSIKHAVDNGVGAIEHGNLMNAETAQMMAEKGIFLTPTLSCYGIMVRKPFEDFLSDDGKAKNAEVMREGLKALQIAHEAGVTICYGSDLLVSMHCLQLEEFTIRAEVLPSPAILRHATTNAALILNQVGKIGIIAPGAYADVLVLKANPLLDITVLDRPEDFLMMVMKQGRVVKSSMEGLVADITL